MSKGSPPFLFLLVCIIAITLVGCTKPPIAQHYIEIASQDDTHFHEFILFPSGDVIEKNGISNLDANNQITFFAIPSSQAQSILESASTMFLKGQECVNGNKELFVFDTQGLRHRCYNDTNAFDTLFDTIQHTTATVTPSRTTSFVHLVYFDRTAYTDIHIHSNGIVLQTTYAGNQITNAQVTTLDQQKIADTLTHATEAVLRSDNQCSPAEANYEYIELQKETQYVYYYNCEKNSQDKQAFFTIVKKLVN